MLSLHLRNLNSKHTQACTPTHVPTEAHTCKHVCTRTCMHMQTHTQLSCDGERYIVSSIMTLWTQSVIGDQSMRNGVCCGGGHSKSQRAHLCLYLRDGLFYVSAQLPRPWLAQCQNSWDGIELI